MKRSGYPAPCHVDAGEPRHASGATAQLVVVGKRTTNARVDLVVEEDGFLTIESHEIGITYEGRFRKEAGEIKGNFTLGPFELLPPHPAVSTGCSLRLAIALFICLTGSICPGCFSR